ncbi:MAG: hypothetical protein KGL39_43185 [Patescibacteria group bacterium]|nr:hypothetical protein [Patescibacteria group bacterium]
MIISVHVSRELIEQWFTTGFEMRGNLLVEDGIPPGAKLVEVKTTPDLQGGWDPLLLFEGAVEGMPPTAEHAKAIIVRHDRELAELEQRLAFANAVCAIQCASHETGDGWLRLGESDADDLREEIRYLELCGSLKRHTTDRLMVWLDPDVDDDDDDEVQP